MIAERFVNLAAIVIDFDYVGLDVLSPSLAALFLLLANGVARGVDRSFIYGSIS